ncbi:sensor histidine kinase [Haliangium sp.]|uniref:sensor histidine kinase n=1 Tax=Haliangium sp. TaxID=2663208 RepID=UPI003D0D6490
MPSAPVRSASAPPPRRIRLPLLAKLLAAFLLPTSALFILFAVVAHEVARDQLEAELGTRLSELAATAALDLRGAYLIGLGPGDEDDRAYLRARRTLEAVREATGVARLYIFDSDLRSRLDTSSEVPIGATHYQAALHRHELARVFEGGASISSVLFEGTDGRLYKAGYAPIRDAGSEGEVVLALGADAPAAYFDRLTTLRHSLLVYGVLLAVVVVVIAVLVAARITRPLRGLAAAAARIGRGELGAAVEAPRSRDELGLLAVTMDEMRRELDARNQHLQLMLSGIAHEVRNPLGGIELFAGILRDELDPDDERRRHVERIERELGYLEAVVTDFLDYARRPAPELAELDLAALAHDVVELEQADADRLHLPIHVQAEPARCRADAGQVRRVVLNLIRNALQAATGLDGAEIRVRVGRERDQVVLSVWNPGPPIPDEVRARIFEPFFTTREKGTGLGLAFARETARDHGGAIELDSGDDGTTFRLRLPGA